MGLDIFPHEQDFDTELLFRGSGNTRGMFSFQKRNLESKEAEMFGSVLPSPPPPNHVWRKVTASSGQSLSFCSDESSWNFPTILEQVRGLKEIPCTDGNQEAWRHPAQPPAAC